MLSSRTVTVLLSVFTTGCFLAISIIMPIFFVRIQRANTLILTQLYKCHQDSNDIWRQLSQSNFERVRSKRQYGHPVKEPIRQCCSCQQGLPGEPGAKGKNGIDGKPGVIGINGRNGRPGKYVSVQNSREPPCQKCPTAPPGPPGYPGQKGLRGNSGTAGLSGTPGLPGRDGPPGPQGIRGLPGDIGSQGPPGDRGKVLNGAPPGPPGKSGLVGPRGKPGNPGPDGSPGVVGTIGMRGQQGERGRKGTRGFPGPNGPKGRSGNRGSCMHCTSIDDKSETATRSSSYTPSAVLLYEHTYDGYNVAKDFINIKTEEPRITYSEISSENSFNSADFQPQTNLKVAESSFSTFNPSLHNFYPTMQASSSIESNNNEEYSDPYTPEPKFTEKSPGYSSEQLSLIMNHPSLESDARTENREITQPKIIRTKQGYNVQIVGSSYEDNPMGKIWSD